VQWRLWRGQAHAYQVAMEERAVVRIVGDVAAAQEALQEAALLAGTPKEARNPARTGPTQLRTLLS
jgi:hypothetical protein